MARQPHVPVLVEASPDGRPLAFTWRGERRPVKVIGTWHLRDRWWSTEGHSDRWYFRCITADLQIFELYRDDALRPPLWVLDRIID